MERFDKKRFGEIVKEIRTTRRQSQESFGNYLGVSQSTIRNWESGNSSPTDVDHLIAIADAWGGKTLLQLLAAVSGEQVDGLPNIKVAEDVIILVKDYLPKSEIYRLMHLVIDLLSQLP